MLRYKPKAIFLALLILTGGCRRDSSQAVTDRESRAAALAIASGLTRPAPDPAVQSIVVPPAGWSLQPLKKSARHFHHIWLSPTGTTAYGVIYFNLPFPVGSELTLWGFLQQMKQIEGRADLISKESDKALPGLRFEAAGGMYTIRTNLIVSGFHAWAVYAGTVNQKPINKNELRLAILAREQTQVGLP